MIYAYLNFLLVLGSGAHGFFINIAGIQHCRTQFAAPAILTEDTSPTCVTVRFTNTVIGKDVVVANVPVGSNLLSVGDDAGVKLPRACRTGLCGSCTCELQTPGTEAGNNVERLGFTIIRACSTKCKAPPGMDEMVIDVYRMKSQTKKPGAAAAHVDPMARFAGDWERDFRSQWAGGVGNVERVPGKGEKLCQYCTGVGRSRCYACDGSGRTMMADNRQIQCLTCAGQKTVGCGYCRGKGVLSKTIF